MSNFRDFHDLKKLLLYDNLNMCDQNLLSHQNELSENINNITRLTHGNFLNKSKISRASTMKSKF